MALESATEVGADSAPFASNHDVAPNSPNKKALTPTQASMGFVESYLPTDPAADVSPLSICSMETVHKPRARQIAG